MIQNIDDVASLSSDEVDDASECGGDSNEEVTVNISHDRVEFSSDFMDYTLHPIEDIFSQLCLWEFVEGTVKENGSISDKQEAVASADSDLDSEDIALSCPIRKRLPRAQFMSAHSQFETHILHLRDKPVIPVLLGNAIPCPDQSPEEHEMYCRAMLLLFKPWRALQELKGEANSWCEALKASNSLQSC